MRILEAWARGVPVIGSPAAVAGLVTHANDDVLVAESPDAFAEAAARLTGSPALREHLVAGGRAALRTNHRPDAIAAATLGVYEQAIARRHSTIAPSRGDRGTPLPHGTCRSDPALCPETPASAAASCPSIC